MNDSDIKILRDSIDILIDENERLKKKIKILEAEKIEPRDKSDEIDWSYHPSRTSKPYEFPPQVGDWPPGPQVGDWPPGPQVGDIPRYPDGYPCWPVVPVYYPYYPYYPYNNYITVSSNATDSKEEK